jgi:hypothetical protein
MNKDGLVDKRFSDFSNGQSSITPDDSFDLKKSHNFSETLVKTQTQTQKIISELELHELRRSGLRIVTEANYYRWQALRIISYKPSVRPYSEPFREISELFFKNINDMKSLVLLFKNERGEYAKAPYNSRFVNKKLLMRTYIRSKQALLIGFSRHEDAIMVTLTLPRVFELAVPVRCCEMTYYVLLQDSILSLLKKRMVAWARRIWKNRKIEVFTAYEYHDDFALHHHIIIFGIPYLLDWSRKYGRKKEDALTYYVKKYGVLTSPDMSKTEVSKRIFTALLDWWLTDILAELSSLLDIDLETMYQVYKDQNGLEGPINDIRRIRNGKWYDDPPPDGVMYSPLKYVMKYLTKTINAMLNDYNVPEQHQAKIFGYWLFAKRFNSYSPSLGPPKLVRVPESEWQFIGVFEESVADEIIEHQLESSY